VSETSEDRPRPTPRPRPGTARPGPTPRARVAGSRRDRDPEATSEPPARPSPRPTAAGARGARTAVLPAADRGRPSARRAMPVDDVPARRRRRPAGALVLAVLCLLTAAGGGWLLYQRLNPLYVDASVFDATRSGVEALYAFDYKHPQQSVDGKLAVLTGDLRDQYKKDLSQGGIIDTYKQVSATTKYDVVDVGLQQINDAQDTATLVVFGQYVVKSVNSGNQPAPQGSECTTTSDGAQSCTQTVQVKETKVGGNWKITDLTLLTTS
jgi:hypothetical protein